jgi:hypothetical protein
LVCRTACFTIAGGSPEAMLPVISGELWSGVGGGAVCACAPNDNATAIARPMAPESSWVLIVMAFFLMNSYGQ